MNRLRTRLQRGQDGFTLVELLVAVSLFGILVGMIATTIVSASRAVDNSKQLNEVNEEARLALVRMPRELRQAQALNAADVYTSADAAALTGAAATNAAQHAAAGEVKSITFSADFNGDGVITPGGSDPETLTYRYVPSSTGDGRITLTANDASGTAVTRPILSAHVSDFSIELRSSTWACDTNGDGITTWQELDTNSSALCPTPDNNGVLDANELGLVDSVVITFTVFEGSHKQQYTTQVDLRNVGR